MKATAEWLGCAIYATAAACFIANGPGLQYDEALLAHGAAHVLHSSGLPPFAYDAGSWIFIGGTALPVMVISYVGAVKDLILVPLFALLGISAAVTRAASVLMTLPLIWLGARVLQRHCGSATATAFACALAIHPTFIAATTFDNGSVAVWMLPLALFAFAVDRYVVEPTAKRAFVAGLAAGFAIWCRANCIWFVVAIVVAIAVVCRREARAALRHAGPIAAGGIAGALPFLGFQIASRGAIFQFLATHKSTLDITNRLDALGNVLIMSAEQRIIWGGRATPAWQTAFAVTIVIVAIVAALISKDPFQRIVAVATLITIALMITSPAQIAEHHLIGVVPFLVACAAIALPPRARAVIFIVYAAIALTHMVVAVRMLRVTGGVDVWSDAIDNVARDRDSTRADVLDWGLYNNLYVIDAARLSGRELFWNATESYSGRGLAWTTEVERGGAYLVPAWQVFPSARIGFLRALRSSGLPCEMRTFSQRNGEEYARLFLVTARVPTSPSTRPGTESSRV